MPVASPVGGLNVIDALAAMPPGDASTLSNMFPYADRVETRPGYSALVTATAINAVGTVSEGFRNLMVHYGNGETVFANYQYDGGGVVRKGRIYSVATDGTLTTSKEIVAAGTTALLSLGEWTNFTSGAGTKYLFLAAYQVTAALAVTFIPQAYDGSSWTVPAITGLDGAAVSGVHSHRGRLWFYGKGNLNAYYLPVGAIAGAVTAFNLGPFATRGGGIIAMRTWTMDGGQGGSDDLAVFVTANGQALVYQGTDPASPATWALVGVFDLGRLAGYTFIANEAEGWVNDSWALKTASDLFFITTAGVLSAKEVLRGSEIGAQPSKSRKVDPLITDSANAWLSGALSVPTEVPNWKACWFPNRRMFLIAANAPTLTELSTGPTVDRVTSTVYAMNTETGAWCQFSGMNIRDMVVVGGGNTLYFIDGSKTIYKFDGTAVSDSGTAITFECRQAYNYLNAPTNKLATLMQPMLKATGNFSLTVEADADFNNGTISAYTSYTVSGTQNLQPQLSPAKYGRAFAAHLKGQTSAGVVSWYATNWLHMNAGGA